MSHTGEKPYICSLCNMGFAETVNLKTHNSTHTGEKHCICIKDFAQTFKLKTHNVVHEYDLNLHLMIHTGGKVHKFCECGKWFVHECNLNLHMMVHTGEKPRKCCERGKWFVHEYSLKLHMMNH